MLRQDPISWSSADSVDASFYENSNIPQEHTQDPYPTINEGNPKILAYLDFGIFGVCSHGLLNFLRIILFLPLRLEKHIYSLNQDAMTEKDGWTDPFTDVTEWRIVRRILGSNMSTLIKFNKSVPGCQSPPGVIHFLYESLETFICHCCWGYGYEGFATRIHQLTTLGGGFNLFDYMVEMI